MKFIPLLIILLMPNLLMAEAFYSQDGNVKVNLDNANIHYTGSTLIINGGNASVNNSSEPLVYVNANNNKLRKVIIRNIRINSRNARINGFGYEQSGLVTINGGERTRLTTNNVLINSRNAQIRNRNIKGSNCAANYCLKIRNEKKFHSNRVIVRSSGRSSFSTSDH